MITYEITFTISRRKTIADWDILKQKYIHQRAAQKVGNQGEASHQKAQEDPNFPMKREVEEKQKMADHIT